ncbi:hypothetical protein CSKR_113601 [Clonorchis sinensis]|uniref:Lysosome-associated membrane glycoprotein 1 n=1 Tax=Clonorchis sinensis TaxID=79923 RepID=A0A8T1MW00_CLOSI|nr:hypothetical protein CSKR_113601 [Clonorchis sinensis]
MCRNLVIVAAATVQMLLIFWLPCANANFAQETVPRYAVKDGESYCLLTEFLMTLDLVYPVDNANENTAKKTFTPTNVSVESTSNCSGRLVLSWFPASGLNDTWSLELDFKQTNSSIKVNAKNYYTLSSLELTLLADKSILPGVKVLGEQKLVSNTPVFTAQQVELRKIPEDKQAPIGYLKLSKAKMQAFMDSKEEKFSPEVSQCSADQPADNTIPIAVGVTLAICIVIALIVFFIFNRRTRRQYGSV